MSISGSPNDLGLGKVASDAEDTQIAKLEGELQRITSRRLSERWCLTCAVILPVDVIFFQACPHIVFMTFSVLVEGVILIILADRWGVHQVREWTQRIAAIVELYFKSQIAKFSTKSD
jgi:hypothetical protein